MQFGTLFERLEYIFKLYYPEHKWLLEWNLQSKDYYMSSFLIIFILEMNTVLPLMISNVHKAVMFWEELAYLLVTSYNGNCHPGQWIHQAICGNFTLEK